MICIIALTVLSVLIDASHGRIGGCQRVVCYISSWSKYRIDPMGFDPDYVDPVLCTHVIYAFATIEDNKLASEEFKNDPKRWWNDTYSKLTRLKLRKPSLKVLLAVGGWGLDSRAFSKMVTSPESRAVFIKSCIELLRKRLFDGLDIHWEYPTLRLGIPEDKQRFTLLLKEMAASFTAEALETQREKLILAVGIGASQRIIDAAYETEAMAREVDFINIKSFNFHGAWDTHVGHNSPLYADDDLSVNFTVQYLLFLRVPASKLVIGLAAYGRHVYLDSPTEYALGTKIQGPGKAGKFTKDPGALAYFEICSILRKDGRPFRTYMIHAPVYYRNRLWLGFEESSSLVFKVHYMRAQRLGGVMIWTMDMDDFNGSQCNQGKYPLLNAVNDQCKSVLQ